MFERLYAINKQYLIAGGVVVILVVANIAGFWFMRSGPPPDSFAGKVIVVSETELTVMDAKGRLRIFTLTASTSVVIGKNTTVGTALATSTFVMVTTDLPGPAATTAKKIRILSTDPFNRPHKGDLP